MSTQIATVAYALGILGLFALNRDRNARTSFALWIPVVWLLIGGSRMVSVWLEMTPPGAGSADQLLEGSPVDRFILTSLEAAGVLVLLGRRHEVRAVLRANWPILLFFLYCAVSTLWSDYPSVAFKRWIKACGDLVVVLIVVTDPDPSAAVKRLLARVGFLLVPLSILLIKFYGELGRAFDSATGEVSYTGVTTGKNLLGMVCFIGGLGSVWSVLQALRSHEGTPRTGPLIAQGTLLAMVLWLFWRTDSMTSLFCFLVASGLMAATSLRAVARRPWVVHLLVVAALSAAIATLFLDVGGALEAMGRNPTLTDRTDVWAVALRFAGNPFFGTGFDSFWLGERLENIWQIFWWHPNEAHSGYLEVFLNLGWIGVVLLAAVLLTGYRHVVATFRSDPDAARLRLGCFVAGLAFNFTEAVFKTFHPLWVLFLLTAIAVPEPVRRAVAVSDRAVRRATTGSVKRHRVRAV
jgi:exopolysaccharide production protein ExoQ